MPLWMETLSTVLQCLWKLPLITVGFWNKDCISLNSMDVCPMPCCKQCLVISFDGWRVYASCLTHKLSSISCHQKRESYHPFTSTSSLGWLELTQMDLSSSHLDLSPACQFWKLHLRVCMTMSWCTTITQLQMVLSCSVMWSETQISSLHRSIGRYWFLHRLIEICYIVCYNLQFCWIFAHDSYSCCRSYFHG